jgi:hypothetical protein
MKAICIDNTHRESDFTLNKVYDVEYIPMCRNEHGFNPCYSIITNKGHKRNISRDRFIPVHKVRYDKLKELGI